MRPATFAALLLAGVALAACQPRQSNDPIVSAVALNETEKVADYLAEGGDPGQKTRDGDPLLYVASGPRGGVDVARQLLEAGADPNARSAEGRTVLQNAASWCDIAMVTLLLDVGANAMATGPEGKRPLDVVCSSPAERRAQVTDILIRAEAAQGER